jgi:hypothetical protein
MEQFEVNLLKRELTKRDLLVIALGLVLLTGVVYAGERLVGRVILRAHVRRELARIYQHAGEQRQRLVDAISAYQQAFGCYPPDHLLSENPPVVEPVTNQLYYELLGTVYDPARRNFTPVQSSTHLPATLLRQYFNIDRFRNSAESDASVRRFLTTPEPLIEVHDKPEMIGLLCFAPNWSDINWDAISAMQIGTWRYNCSKPQHNLSGYDLWMEVQAPGTNLVIGNW